MNRMSPYVLIFFLCYILKRNVFTHNIFQDRLKRCVEKIESSLSKDEIKAPACVRNNLLLTPQKSYSSSIFAVSDFSLSDYSHCQEYKKEIAEEVKCLEDEELSRDIKELLYKTDSQTIFNAIINDIDGLKTKLLHAVVNKSDYVKLVVFSLRFRIEKIVFFFQIR